ncbi:MAG: T9SS type A sorting domain-containing protein [Bacteroidetes bacterium]|nr:T9SS type A sorting domain-containing protein [Bacteroidota bacterium]
MEIGTLGVNDRNFPGSLQAKAWPNPATNEVSVAYTLTEECDINVSILSLTGEKIRGYGNLNQQPGEQTLVWDLHDENGNIVPSGLYFFVITTPWNLSTCKILKL